MNVYIAKDHDGYTRSIVLAKSQKDAEILWQGEGLIPCSIREIKPEALDDHPTGVIKVLGTRDRRFYEHGSEKSMITVKKV